MQSGPGRRPGEEGEKSSCSLLKGHRLQMRSQAWGSDQPKIRFEWWLNLSGSDSEIFLNPTVMQIALKIVRLWWAICGNAAKSLQSCPNLCDPKDSSPPGSPVPGILQARTLEWVAISFSNAWKWKVKSESEVAQSCLPGSSVHGIF